MADMRDVLHLDTQFPQRNHERSRHAQTTRQGFYVPQTVVLHPRLDLGHLRLLLLQQLYFRRGEQRGLRANALADEVVCARWVVEPGVPGRCGFCGVLVETYGQ